MILEESYSSFVNLDHRVDRFERMIITLARAGISAERTRGMYPNEYEGDPARVRVMMNRTPGAIGCYFSQRKIMEEAHRRNQHAFVMEDDLVFCADFRARMEILSSWLSGRPWDVIWMGGTFHVNPPQWHPELGRDAELTDHPRILRTYGAFSTHAYIVNRGSLVSVLSELDRLLDTSVGIDWSFIQMQPHLYTYAFVPGCISQYDNWSDIGNGMTIFSNFHRLGPYWWADTMEEFDPESFDWAEARS